MALEFEIRALRRACQHVSHAPSPFHVRLFFMQGLFLPETTSDSSLPTNALLHNWDKRHNPPVRLTSIFTNLWLLLASKCSPYNHHLQTSQNYRYKSLDKAYAHKFNCNHLCILFSTNENGLGPLKENFGCLLQI